jgi:hypothetical protein
LRKQIGLKKSGIANLTTVIAVLVFRVMPEYQRRQPVDGLDR